MKDKRLSLRLSVRRLNRLRAYAASQDKTITQIVSDWIDTLPIPANLTQLDKDEQV
jgi:predicted membrane-bound mannosyltransferase